MFQVQTTTNTLTSSYYLVDVAPSNEGIYTCYGTNGYSNASYSMGIIVLPPIVASVADYWYIFLIIGLIILIVLIAVFAYYYHRHNVGESYPGNHAIFIDNFPFELIIDNFHFVVVTRLQREPQSI